MAGNCIAWLILLITISDLSVQSLGDQLHIVFMVVDDWGWANAGYHRSPPTPEVVTPNIDSLVKQGLELDQHYVFKLCSPSRCSLLTGRLPIHVDDNSIHPANYIQTTQFQDFRVFLIT